MTSCRSGTCSEGGGAGGRAEAPGGAAHATVLGGGSPASLGAVAPPHHPTCTRWSATRPAASYDDCAGRRAAASDAAGADRCEEREWAVASPVGSGRDSSMWWTKMGHSDGSWALGVAVLAPGASRSAVGSVGAGARATRLRPRRLCLLRQRASPWRPPRPRQRQRHQWRVVPLLATVGVGTAGTGAPAPMAATAAQVALAPLAMSTRRRRRRRRLGGRRRGGGRPIAGATVWARWGTTQDEPSYS